MTVYENDNRVQNKSEHDVIVKKVSVCDGGCVRFTAEIY